MKMLTTILGFATLATVNADTNYYVIYIQGQKVGYIESSDQKDTYNGQPAVRTTSHSVMDSMVRGTDSSATQHDITWVNPEGHLLRYKQTSVSGGRTQIIDEIFGPKSVEISINTGGAKIHRTLRTPAGPLIDDPLSIVKRKTPTKGQQITYWSLDDSALAFKQIKLKFLGPAVTTLSGTKVTANAFDIETDSMTLHAFATSSGEMVHVLGPMGMDIRHESKAVALAKPKKGAGTIDLAQLTSLKTDKPIEDSEHATGTVLRFASGDISTAPSDPNQTITKTDAGYLVDIHPTQFDLAKPVEIKDVRAGHEKWTQAGLYLPADSAEFKQLAAKIIGNKTDVAGASTSIVHYVSAHMKYVDGIDISRDASEILKTKEGVCRDYSVLTVTLLRAAGIPARIIGGLVYDDGAFYGHAWNEVWDGQNWVGIDATNNIASLPAEYIKLGQGDVGEAFGKLPPAEAKLIVIEVRH